MPSPSFGNDQRAAAGGWCEVLWDFLRLPGEPPLTRVVAGKLATAHWFDISTTRRDLGYVPEISVNEGLKQLTVWLTGEST